LAALHLSVDELHQAEEDFKFGRHVLITLWLAWFVKKLSWLSSRFYLVFVSMLSLR